MRTVFVSRPLVCRSASTLLAAGIVLTLPDLSLAQGSGMPSKPTPGETSCTCPGNAPEKPKLWPKPKYAELKPDLSDQDEIAALEAVHLALTEVGDGFSYVWHQKGGRLSGVIQPTSTFRDSSGKICRHLMLAMSAGGIARSTEGIACRLINGSWQLEG